MFDNIIFSEDDLKSVMKEKWFDINAVLNYCGMDYDEWKGKWFPHRVYDCIIYYGYYNIFGESNYSYKIKEV